jgi:hypothetical protein
MQSAKDRDRSDDTNALDRSPKRRILLERPVRTRLIVVSRIRRERTAQVALTKNNEVVQTFAAKRANQSFR